MLRITGNVRKRLWPVRAFTSDDGDSSQIFRLETPLKRSEFSVPLIEKYEDGRTYYGLHDLTKSGDRATAAFVTMASAFFEDVLRSQPSSGTQNASAEIEIYPHVENRQLVTAHLRRERSRLLALQCKQRDKFKCQVCDFSFEKRYGQLGVDFAEAHHRRPLSSLKGQVRTTLDDLITVCANCHRMLHRMSGRGSDVNNLRKSLGAE